MKSYLTANRIVQPAVTDMHFQFQVQLAYKIGISFRYFEKQEVKTKCPACRGTCSCTICMKQKLRISNHKVKTGLNFLLWTF